MEALNIALRKIIALKKQAIWRSINEFELKEQITNISNLRAKRIVERIS